MIYSTKESRDESILRKIHNSVKEINEAVKELERLLGERPEIVQCSECKYFEELDLSGYCHNPETYAIKSDSDFGCILGGRRADDWS